MPKKPILISGAHRSGSTWVGKTIAISNKVRYVHEPFNIQMDVHKAPFQFWFQYLSNTSDHDLIKKSKMYLRPFYKCSLPYFLKKQTEVKSLNRKYRFLRDEYLKLTKRTLIKDPIAFLSTRWLYNYLNCDVIITIRHPAAFIASIKVKNWHFDFNNFLDQKQLMDNELNLFKDEILEFSTTKKNIIDQGILLWNIIYSIVLKLSKEYVDEWYFVKHEDLSKNPMLEYEKIFNFLKLDFSDKVKKNIEESSNSKKETSLKRNSIENIYTWKNRLSPDEILQIKKNTKNIWSQFYTENDW